jgi:hypothetical protein
MESLFPSMGHRAWFAWQCLERNERGEPPTWRELEDKHDLSNGSIHKIVWDISTRPSFGQLERVARALNTTPQWLLSESGESPAGRWPITPRPAHPKKSARKSASGTVGRDAGLSRDAEAAFGRDAEKLRNRPEPSRSRGARK